MNNSSWYKGWHQNPKHVVFHWAIFIIVVLVSASYLLNQIQYSLGEKSLGIPQSTEQLQASALNSSFLSQAANFRSSGDVASLVSAAKSREETLKEWMQTNPAAVIAAALTENQKSGLPAQAQQYLEKVTTQDGTFEWLIADNKDGTDENFYHLVTKAGERLALHFAGGEPKMLTGTKVSIKGVQIDTDVALALQTSGTTSLQVTAPAPLAHTEDFGSQKTAVILVRFADHPEQVFDVSGIRSIFFTGTSSVSNFDRENSYGQTWLTGDVYGPYTIAVLSNHPCEGIDQTNFLNDMQGQARAAATAHGDDIANARKVYVFQTTPGGCGWWGLGSVGGGQNSSANINDASASFQPDAHEMGHNFGMYHSHSLDCGSVPLGSSCNPPDEYGDSFDNMGYSNYHWNAFQKELLGWLNYGSSPPITTVTASGTYTIGAYEAQNSTPKAIKIPRTGGYYFYVEKRTATGFDGPLAVGYPSLAGNANVMNGVLIHYGPPSSPSISSDLLDMTSSSSFMDAALVAGQSWTDTSTGTTIAVTSANSSGATVQVTFGTPPPIAPTVTISANPSTVISGGASTLSWSSTNATSCTASGGWTGAKALSGSEIVHPTINTTYTLACTGTGGTTPSSTTVTINTSCTHVIPTMGLTPAPQTGARGQSLNYTYSLRNNDASACGSSTFTATSGLEAGWSQSAIPSMTLAPGQTLTSPLSVTSSTSATVGAHNINENISFPGGTLSTGVAGAYVVSTSTSCTHVNPTVSLSPATSTASAGTAVNYTLSVRNNDVSPCTSSTFNLTGVVPSGWTGTLTPTTLSLAPGATSTSVFKVTSSLSASGSNTVTSTAKNAADTTKTATASATYVIGTAANTAPVVNAGADQTIVLPTNSANLSATVTDDGKPNPPATTTVAWTKTSGAGTVTFSAPASKISTATFSAAGTYVLRLTASDSVLTASDELTVTVLPVGSPGAFSDTFTRANASALGNGWQQVMGAFSIVSNHAWHTSSAALATQPGLIGPTQTVSADMQRGNSVGAAKLCLILRYQNATNYYSFCENQGGSSAPHIYKVVNGNSTQIDHNSSSSGNSYVYRKLTATASGTTLTLKLDSTVYATATDSTFATGSAGFYISGSGGTTGESVDNWSETIQ